MEIIENIPSSPQRTITADDVAFLGLQERFTKNFQDIFLNDLAEKTVVIIPSLSLDSEILKTITGVIHYEERMLCMLLLLRMPRTRVIYITSVLLKIASLIITCTYFPELLVTMPVKD